MDKAKNMEVLRSMKFMQRKEEAKKRAMYEVEQTKDIERRVLSAQQSNRKRQREGPIIIHENTFPTSMYGYSRMKFHSKVDDVVDNQESAPKTGDAVEDALAALKGDNRDADEDHSSEEEREEEEEDESLDPTVVKRK
ncbi:hypothetical protein ADEAN_000745000 [Angomonas deanei]|uniref:Uncharacterized protein n=1 Tax=Angomonas deanei TaxID=59799 RepID=A0A7G2CJH1_9TRYP|nr:hypothetical protein ADEAN_000745000 [Angomonas deanei]